MLVTAKNCPEAIFMLETDQKLHSIIEFLIDFFISFRSDYGQIMGE